MIDFELGDETFPAHWAAVDLHPDYANNVGLDLSAPDAVIVGDYAIVGFELEISSDYAQLAANAPELHEVLDIWGFGGFDAENPSLLGQSHRATTEVQERYDTFLMLYGNDPSYGMVAPGDSGGPSFNRYGELVSVHSQLMAEDFPFSYDGLPPRTVAGGAALDMRVDAVEPWIYELIADGLAEDDDKADEIGWGGSGAGGSSSTGCGVAAGPSLSLPSVLALALLLLLRQRRPDRSR